MNAIITRLVKNVVGIDSATGDLYGTIRNNTKINYVFKVDASLVPDITFPTGTTAKEEYDAIVGEFTFSVSYSIGVRALLRVSEYVSDDSTRMFINFVAVYRDGHIAATDGRRLIFSASTNNFKPNAYLGGFLVSPIKAFIQRAEYVYIYPGDSISDPVYFEVIGKGWSIVGKLHSPQDYQYPDITHVVPDVTSDDFGNESTRINVADIRAGMMRRRIALSLLPSAKERRDAGYRVVRSESTWKDTLGNVLWEDTYSGVLAFHPEYLLDAARCGVKVLSGTRIDAAFCGVDDMGMLHVIMPCQP